MDTEAPGLAQSRDEPFYSTLVKQWRDKTYKALGEDAPAGDTSAEDMPVEDTPAEDMPVEDSSPGEDTPSEEFSPVDDAVFIIAE